MADAKAITERLRRARRLTITVGTMKFNARRPTDLEVGRMGLQHMRRGELAMNFVDGWEGVRMCDLVKGDPDETLVEFDSELWQEFVADQPDLMKEIGEQIMQRYLDHAKVEGEEEKN